jgi:hypothetical protein
LLWALWSRLGLFIYLFLQVLIDVISGGLTPSFTTKEAEQMGARIISMRNCYFENIFVANANLVF